MCYPGIHVWPRADGTYRGTTSESAGLRKQLSKKNPDEKIDNNGRNVREGKLSKVIDEKHDDMGRSCGTHWIWKLANTADVVGSGGRAVQRRTVNHTHCRFET